MINFLKKWFWFDEIIPPDTLFKVKVVSHTKDHPWVGDYWYRCYIGKEFEIVSETDTHYITRRESWQGTGIYKRDAKKVY